MDSESDRIHSVRTASKAQNFFESFKDFDLLLVLSKQWLLNSLERSNSLTSRISRKNEFNDWGARTDQNCFNIETEVYDSMTHAVSACLLLTIVRFGNNGSFLVVSKPSIT